MGHRKDFISMATPPLISISIVSHGHGQMVAKLLSDIRNLTRKDVEVILTLNIPEPSGNHFSDFDEIHMIENPKAKGFGDNHNSAFKVSRGSHFLVLNPDVRLQNVNIPLLLNTLHDPAIGVVAPAVHSSSGPREVTARHFPTFASLTKKALRQGSPEADYAFSTSPISVDWVAGMFMLFRREVFERIKGFDTRFFLYYEDVDLCRRLQALDMKVVYHPGTSVIHDAQMTSHRNLRYMLWHLRSMARFLLSSY